MRRLLASLGVAAELLVGSPLRGLADSPVYRA